MSSVNPDGRRGAVIIGIDTYPNLQDKQLRGAANDAKEISMRLEADGRISKEDHKLLINEDATSQNIRDAIDEVVYKQDKCCELIYFYFAGHGFKNASGVPHFAPYNFSPGKHYSTSISMKEIRDTFADYYMNSPARNRTVCAFIDCCYGGSFFKSERALDNPQDFADKARENLIGEGIIGLASMDVNEKTREKGGYRHPTKSDEDHTHGIFTYHLLEGLEGLATENGVITFSRLQSHMQQAMKNENQKLKLLIEGDAPLLDAEIAISLSEVGNYLLGLANEIKKNRENDLLDDFMKARDTAKKIKEYELMTAKYRSNTIRDYTLEVKNSKRTLDSTLEKSRGKIIGWIFENIGQNNPNKDLIRELYDNSCPKLVDILNSLQNILYSDKVDTADDFRRCLLYFLYIVIKDNNSDAKSFIRDNCGYCIQKYFKDTSVIGPPKPSSSPGAVTGRLEGEKTEPKEEALDE